MGRDADLIEQGEREGQAVPLIAALLIECARRGARTTEMLERPRLCPAEFTREVQHRRKLLGLRHGITVAQFARYMSPDRLIRRRGRLQVLSHARLEEFPSRTGAVDQVRAGQAPARVIVMLAQTWQ